MLHNRSHREGLRGQIPLDLSDEVPEVRQRPSWGQLFIFCTYIVDVHTFLSDWLADALFC